MPEAMHPDTRLGPVCLSVGDLHRSLEFYQAALGLRLRRRENNKAFLGTGQLDWLVLEEGPSAAIAHGSTGLFHFALLVPSRLELARTLVHLHETRTPCTGYADHSVSEAIYLSDPDGHGIEIYRDRPRSEWEYPGGQLKLTVDPLDVQKLKDELDETSGEWTGLHADTVMGHIHLQVSNLKASEQFYTEVLGFERMACYGSSASFLSAGGYHHHLAINIWAGVGAPPPPRDAARLLWFSIRLPDADEFDRMIRRLHNAGLQTEPFNNGVLLRDPDGIVLRMLG